MTIHLDIIASRIKEIRNHLGMSQLTFAENLGLTKGYISLCESGKREPSVGTLLKMSRLGNVPIEYIIGLYNQEGMDLELAQLMKEIQTTNENDRKVLLDMIRDTINGVKGEG